MQLAGLRIQRIYVLFFVDGDHAAIQPNCHAVIEFIRD
jgi:hypothetical protein